MNEKKYFEILKLFIDFHKTELDNTQLHKDYDVNKNNYHLNSYNGKLAISVLKNMNKLNGLINDLKKVLLFTRRFQNRKFYEQNDVNELEYLKYHYEVFMHKIHTILEVKKLILNEFYNIGLREKDCNWKNLKDKRIIKDKPISNLIELYFKSFEHIITHRNLNTHRAYFGDKINEDLDTKLHTHKNCDKFQIGNDDNMFFFSKIILENNIKKYKKERNNYKKNGIEIAEEYVKIFNYLILINFLKKIGKLQPTTDYESKSI